MKKLVSILLTVAVLMATFIPVAAMAERHHFYVNNVECWSESCADEILSHRDLEVQLHRALLC